MARRSPPPGLNAGHIPRRRSEPTQEQLSLPPAPAIAGSYTIAMIMKLARQVKQNTLGLPSDGDCWVCQIEYGSFEAHSVEHLWHHVSDSEMNGHLVLAAWGWEHRAQRQEPWTIEDVRDAAGRRPRNDIAFRTRVQLIMMRYLYKRLFDINYPPTSIELEVERSIKSRPPI